MAEYVDISELRLGVYFESATLDDRFKWQEIDPDPAVGTVINTAPSGEDPVYVWADNFRRYRLLGCAHREADRDGALCTHCGHQNPYEPPKQEAARKTRAKKTAARKKTTE